MAPVTEKSLSTFYKMSSGKFEDVQTEDGEGYKFYPIVSNSISLKIKASHDAHIALTTARYEGEPMYEVFFGGWKNTKSGIGKNRVKPDLVEVITPNILDEKSYTGFWIRWGNGTIAAGIQGDKHPFMVYNDSKLFDIRYFGVCTRWGASGHWIIENEAPKVVNLPAITRPRFHSSEDEESDCSTDSFESIDTEKPETSTVININAKKEWEKGIDYSWPMWVSGSNGKVPPRAVVMGTDVTGETVYLARAYHRGVYLEGPLIPSHRVTYISWAGRRYPKKNYEVLCFCPEVDLISSIVREIFKKTGCLLTKCVLLMIIVLFFICMGVQLILYDFDKE